MQSDIFTSVQENKNGVICSRIIATTTHYMQRSSDTHTSAIFLQSRLITITKPSFHINTVQRIEKTTKRRVVGVGVAGFRSGFSYTHMRQRVL